MMDVISDAWPWVFLAFLIGLLCGWLVTWLFLRDRSTRLEAELAQSRAQKPLAAATMSGLSPEALAVGSAVIGKKVRLNDLRLIEGIGPKIEGLMNADGIRTWTDLSQAAVPRLEKILEAAGPRYNMHVPETWPRQAELLVAGRWAEFKALTDELDGGR